MKKLLLLVNMHSGLKNSKNKLLEAIDVFCREGYTVTTYVTQGPHDAYDYLMKNRVRYDVLCVFGGDGTMNEVTNALMKKEYKPLIGYFPSGTMNDFGSNFDLGNDCQQIAEKICKGRERAFDVGIMNGRCFNYVAAFGAMCDVPFSTKRDAKEVFGNIAYILEGISRLPEIRKHHISYTVNGKTYSSDILFGLIYSGNRVAGMQLASARQGRVDDGQFNVLIVDYVPGIFDTPDVLTTLLQSKKFIHSYRCDQIMIECDEDLIWTLDGEEAKVKDKAEIVIKEKALKLLA